MCEKNVEEQALVIASRVKEMNKDAGFATGADYLIALSKEVHRMLSASQARARENGRKTLKLQDV